MSFEDLRMIRCDGEGCGALETMPKPDDTGDEVVMLVAPKGWMVKVTTHDPPSTYCPNCKYLHGA